VLSNLSVGRCSSLNVESLDDIERTLRKAGYSDGAVKEILKWYKQNNTERRT
jgi:hypothetical protein